MEAKKFRILVLDGGGSKGVYSLGILKELEKKLGGLLYQHFELIYGTSTGAIIGALVALGEPIEAIENYYLDLIPKIMSRFYRDEKSKTLKEEADTIFGAKKFDAFKTDIGIVSMNYDTAKPLIFKSNVKFAHGLKATFIPGFGCSISDAVQSSCSAYPIFDVKEITTDNQGIIKAVDGGFIANSATLFAVIDAHKAYQIADSDIRLLNVGVGHYIEKPISLKYKIAGKFKQVQLVEKVLTANTNTNEILAKLLYPRLSMIRISETFNQPEYGTNMVEVDQTKLKKMLQLGRDSFAKFEVQIENLFN